MKKHPSLFIVAIAAISIQCSIANNNLPPIPDPAQVPIIDEPINENIQETIDPSIEGSPLIKIIRQMEAFFEDLKDFLAESKLKKAHTPKSLSALESAVASIEENIHSAKQHTIKFLQKKEDINDYLYFLLQQRTINILARYNNINTYIQPNSGVFIQPTSLPLFEFLNDKDNTSKELLRINKQARIRTISLYEFSQLLIKETLSLCNIESLDKKTIDILRVSPSLHAFITNPEKEDLGHPDEVIALYHIIESILLGYPKPIEDNKQRHNINKEILTIKKEISFKKSIKDKSYPKYTLIRNLYSLVFSKDITNPSLLNAINYLSKDLDGEIIRNHFSLNMVTGQLDKKINYVQSKGAYPLPKPAFLEKAIAKYEPVPMSLPKVIKLKTNVQRRKLNLPTNTKTKKNQQPDKRTTIYTPTNAAPPTNEKLEKKEKVLESIEAHSQHVEDPINLPSSTLSHPESPTDDPLKKTAIGIIPSQPLQEKGANSTTNEAAEKTDTGIIPSQPWQEERHSPLETFSQAEDPISLPSITLTNPEPPTDEVLEKTEIEDYLIYYSDYNEYKDAENYENNELIPDTEKNVLEPNAETWKQPAGARKFNSNLVITRATSPFTTTHQETVNKIFDPKRQCKVKFREFVNLWESKHIGGRVTNSGHGGSHRKIIAPDGTVVTGIFTHGDGTVYGKKSIQYLKMALEYVGLQSTE